MKRLRQRLRQAKRENPATPSRVLPRDPVEFCRSWLRYEPYAYTHPFLRDESHFVAAVMARQTGKTFNGMAKLLHIAFIHPGSTILVTAPKLGQAKNIAFKHLHAHLSRMRAHDPAFYNRIIGPRNAMRTMIKLRNGSTILAESPVPETIRGHTAKAVYLMEANFIRDDEDLYTAVLFTLNTTDGYLIAESTPWNRDSVFHRMLHDPAYHRFGRHTVPYTAALPPNGPLTPGIVEALREQLAGDPARWRREMLCEWTEDQDAWLPASLITLCQDSAIEYQSADKRLRGAFYAGVDFGKRRDHTVVTVIEALSRHKILRHMHVFPLDTPYGAVIGYTRRLQDTWRTLRAIHADKTGVGDYIVEDMERSGLHGVTGVNFTDTSKEALATSLRESMRTADCPACGWTGYIQDAAAARPTCPHGCTHDDRPVTLRPHLHIPYDPDLFAELNVERYELAKSGRTLFNHAEGAHDDRFWSLALAVHASDTVATATKPLAQTTD